MKAIILAAGKGTRLSPIGDTTPKLLIPVFNKPLIHRFVDILKDYVEEILFVIDAGDFGEKIRSYANKQSWPVKITFAIQKEAKGTGAAVQCAKDLIIPGEDIFVLYGDDIYSKTDIAQLAKVEYGMIGKAVNDPEKWGILHQDSRGNLTEIIEKPQEFVGNLANIGIFKLNSEIFELYEKVPVSPRGEIELTDTVTLFAQKHNVKVLAMQGYWYPLGYPWHILDAHEKLIGEVRFETIGEIEHGAVIKGRLKLGKNSIIKSGCYLEGDIIIGENSIIGPNAFIRGTTVIGSNCRIGAFCEIKNSVLFDNSIASHLVYLGDSIVGYNSNLSAGTITNVLYPDWKIKKRNIEVNIKDKKIDSGREKLGSIIGDNVNIAAGTILYPGVKIGPGINTDPGEIVTIDKY